MNSSTLEAHKDWIVDRCPGWMCFTTIRAFLIPWALKQRKWNVNTYLFHTEWKNLTFNPWDSYQLEPKMFQTYSFAAHWKATFEAILLQTEKMNNSLLVACSDDTFNEGSLVIRCCVVVLCTCMSLAVLVVTKQYFLSLFLLCPCTSSRLMLRYSGVQERKENLKTHKK